MKRLIVGAVLCVGSSCGGTEQRAHGTEQSAHSTAPPTASAPICRMEACWKLAADDRLSKAQRAALLQAGCDQGDALSCDYLSQLHATIPCPPNYCLDEEGIAIARRACELGAGAPCFYVVETLGDKLSAKEREHLYTRACFESYSVMSWAPACTQAEKLATQRGDTQRATLIRKHFDLASDCKEEVAEACSALEREPKWSELKLQ